MLSDADVLAMQAQITESLPDACEVIRPVRVSDGAGAFTETTESVVTTRCRVAPSGQDLAQIAARLSIAASWMVTLPAGTDARESDRIVCKGRTWEVAYLLEYPYDFGVFALCREVR